MSGDCLDWSVEVHLSWQQHDIIHQLPTSPLVHTVVTMLLRIVSAITIIGNITRLTDWINNEKIFQVLLILFSWNLKKTLIRQNIPLPSTTPASYCQTSPWRFVSGQKDIFKSFSNQELLFYRFNLYSETGDYNWLFGYSIELNPDKMNMCKYPWLDNDHPPSFGVECS